MSQVSLNHTLFTETKDRTILITGAAHGIGLATTKLLNEKGANVVLADLSQFRIEAEETIIAQLAHPDRAAFFPANIVNWTELTECLEATIARFGGLDIIVAYAGIMESRPVLDLEDVDEDGKLLESYEAGRVIDVNLKGTFNILRLGLHYMKTPTFTPSPQSQKSILLVASTSSYFGGTGVTAYIASKHGVLGLLRACQPTAQKYGVRVNAIAPFLTPTHITAGFAQRWEEAGLEKNTPDRVAEAIALVAFNWRRDGDCIMVAGRFLRELEGPRMRLFPTWLGEGYAVFINIGGYVLPSKY